MVGGEVGELYLYMQSAGVEPAIIQALPSLSNTPNSKIFRPANLKSCGVFYGDGTLQIILAPEYSVAVGHFLRMQVTALATCFMKRAFAKLG
jgi:hypothetical protein